MNHADSASAEPIDIIGNDLSDSKRDRLLRSREALQNNNFGKTEVKVKYTNKEKLKLSKLLEDVKISFTHCGNVIQGTVRVVGEVDMKKSIVKKTMEPFWK